ncbi:unnamed protein product, partial [Meganyctiphanes norvegica]
QLTRSSVLYSSVGWECRDRTSSDFYPFFGQSRPQYPIKYCDNQLKVYYSATELNDPTDLNEASHIMDDVVLMDHQEITMEEVNGKNGKKEMSGRRKLLLLRLQERASFSLM